MSTPAIVDIVDVIPQAVKIPVEAIVPSDKVFDIWGKTYDVLDVKAGRVRKDGSFGIWILRADNPGVWECIGEVGNDWRPTITVIPSFGARGRRVGSW